MFLWLEIFFGVSLDYFGFYGNSFSALYMHYPFLAQMTYLEILNLWSNLYKIIILLELKEFSVGKLQNGAITNLLSILFG